MIADSRPIDTSADDTTHVAAARQAVALTEMRRSSPRADAANASTPVRPENRRSTNQPTVAANATVVATSANTTSRGSRLAAPVVVEASEYSSTAQCSESR